MIRLIQEMQEGKDQPTLKWSVEHRPNDPHRILYTREINAPLSWFIQTYSTFWHIIIALAKDPK